MKTTTIKTLLQAAVFTGAIGILPNAASADTSDAVPDHATAAARGGADTTVSPEEKADKVPDHQQAEEKGTADTTPTKEESAKGVPDHAQAEARGAQPNE